MDVQIDACIYYAKVTQNKKVRRIDLARAMWPKSNNPYNNLNNLEKGRTRSISLDQIEAVIRITGIPVEQFIK